MQWDVVAVQPVGNRSFIVEFSDGLTTLLPNLRANSESG